MNGTHANRKKKRAATLNAVALNLLVCDSFSRLVEACTWDKKTGYLNQLLENSKWWKKVLKLFVLVSYLFCLGFELLGGILLKLEPIFLNGFLFACKSLKACEVEALLDTEVVDGGAKERPSA